MVGNSFTAYVDGVQVGEFTDSRLPHGQIGILGVDVRRDRISRCYFDLFAVWQIVY